MDPNNNDGWKLPGGDKFTFKYNPHKGEDDLKDVDDAEKSADEPDEDESKDSPDNQDKVRADDDSTESSNDDNNTIGEGFKASDEDPKAKGSGRGKHRRRNRIVAFVAVLSMLGGFFVGTSELSSLKLETMMKAITSHESITSNDSVGSELQNIIKKLSITTATQCGTTVNKDCSVSIPGEGPVPKVMRALHKSDFESKLPYEITYDKKGQGSYYIELKTDTSKGTFIGTGASIDSKLLDRELNRKDFHTAILTSMENETLWQKSLIRFGRSYFHQKYDWGNCVFACRLTDVFKQKQEDAFFAAKLKLAEIVSLRSSAVGAVVGCLLNTKCETSSPGTTCATNECDELHGAVQEEGDAEVEKAVGAAASGFGSETADKLVGYISDIREAGSTSKWALQKVLAKTLGQAGADKVTPIIGQLKLIDQVAKVISTISNGYQKIKKLGYLVNSAAAAHLYNLMQNYVDETHTGYLNGNELASMNHLFDSGSQCQTAITPTCEPQIGGLAGAEDTPIYNYITYGNTGNTPVAPTASIGNSLLGQAFADAGVTTPVSGTQSYLCEDNLPVHIDQLACADEVLGGTTSTFQTTARIFGDTGLKQIADIYEASPLPGLTSITGDLTSWVTGPLASAAESVAENVPGISDLLGLVTREGAQIFTFMGQQLFNSPITSNMSGGRTYSQTVAGADAAMNDYAAGSLGGQQLSPQQVAMIQNREQSAEQAQFAGQPLWTRLFSTDSQYSLVSKLSLDIPLNWQTGITDAFMHFISNPFATLAHQFGSLLTGISHAAAVPINDPYGVPQAGYIQVPDDPDTYWNQHCSDNSAQAYQNDADYQSAPGGKGWMGNTVTDDTSGMQVHATTNPCLLIQATTMAAGARFDQSFLTTAQREIVPTSGDTAQ